LESDNSSKVKTILKFLPDLSLTPPEKTHCPKGLDKFEKKLDSERSRIVSAVKMRSLLALKNEVFRNRSLQFHWDLSKCVETNLLRASQIGDSQHQTADLVSGIEQESQVQYNYELNSLVIVNTGISGQGQGFWIGEVVEVHRQQDKTVGFLSVHWYEFYGTTDVYTGRYKPHLVKLKGRSRKDSPWIDTITTDTVLVSFPRLTSDKRLPSAVSKHLREHFSATILNNSN